jgi:hypothetical protein
MVCGQIALSRGERDMWFQSPFIVSLLVISVVCFAAFLWWDSRDGNQNRVFHIRTIVSQHTYTAAFGLVLLCGLFLGAGLYVIPQFGSSSRTTPSRQRFSTLSIPSACFSA